MTSYAGNLVTLYTDIEIVLGMIITASALYSYFHKTPFPQDMSLIIGCMVVYYTASIAVWALKKYFVGEYFLIFKTSFAKQEKFAGNYPKDELQGLVDSHKEELADTEVRVSSSTEMFSSLYWIKIHITTKSGKKFEVR